MPLEKIGPKYFSIKILSVLSVESKIFKIMWCSDRACINSNIWLDEWSIEQDSLKAPLINSKRV